MVTTIIAYVLIASFFIFERRLRQGSDAKSLAATETDRGSTAIIARAYGVCILALLAAPLLNALHVGEFEHLALFGWVGVALIVVALGFRVWAMRVLGAFYTRTLRVSSKQHIVQQGPYRLIRHPGYLASIFLWIGGGVAVLNWITLIVIVAVMPAAYTYRIRSEEAMLSQTFGEEFTAYKAHTWKLIPFVY